MKKNTKNTNGRTMEIIVEVAEKTRITKEIPVNDCAFTMATDVAFEILTVFGKPSKTHFAIYMAILRHRNTKNNRCFPSIETIAKETNTSVRTVKRTIDELEEKGYLSINSGMRGIANNYYFPKEWFYEYFKEDYLQKNAQRHKRPLQSNRKVSAEKQLEKEKEKNEKLEKENKEQFIKHQKEIEQLNQAHDEENAKLMERIRLLEAQMATQNKEQDNHLQETKDNKQTNHSKITTSYNNNIQELLKQQTNINLSKIKEEKFDDEEDEDKIKTSVNTCQNNSKNFFDDDEDNNNEIKTPLYTYQNNSNSYCDGYDEDDLF